MAKKFFILDTNILLYSPQSLNNFEGNDIGIPQVVIEELDNLKTKNGDIGFNAREALRILSNIYLSECSDRIRLLSKNNLDVLPAGWDRKKPDNIILANALNEIKNGFQPTFLISNDVAMQIKGASLGIKVQSYNNTKVEIEDVKYTGRRDIEVSSSIIDDFYKNGEVILTDETFSENEFVTMISNEESSKSAIGMFRNGKVHKLYFSQSTPMDVKTKNAGQKFALEALMSPVNELPLVFLKGSAGTAKTFLSVAAGLEQTYNQHKYDRVLIVRPNIKFDDDIGYLKGDEEQKIAPLIRPFLDNIEALMSKEKDPESRKDMVQELFDRDVIRAEAMAYMRGRSIQNTFLILDEAQNATPNQLLGIITRAGAGTKIVVCGDYKQIDNPKVDSCNNGLVYASERMKGSPLCAQVAFSGKECVRSSLAKEAATRLSLY